MNGNNTQKNNNNKLTIKYYKHLIPLLRLQVISNVFDFSFIEIIDNILRQFPEYFKTITPRQKRINIQPPTDPAFLRIHHTYYSNH